jgi:hypothetical protein
MEILKHDKKTEKLCTGFLLLDERDQEHFLSILKALLFAKKTLKRQDPVGKNNV